MRVAYNGRTMARRAAKLSTGVVCAILAVAALSPVHSQNVRCRNSANVPLPDLTSSYRGLDFGLYPGRRTTPPDGHLAAGLDRAKKRIQPLDADGNPSRDGKIVLMSIGMSNTRSEFGRFVVDTESNRAVNRRLTIMNASMSGADAIMWTDVNSRPWQVAIAKANSGRNSAKQVQVIWVKQAHRRTVPFPQELEVLKNDLALILRTASDVFPNLQIAYLSSRTRSGAETRQGPGEPQAYETAFAVRRLIQEQIDRTTPAPDVPWVSWGPYLWSNGTPRSDGFVWSCEDLGRDMLHPSEGGSRKVADQLMAFFMTAPTATPWFLEPSLSETGPRIDRIVPSRVNGEAPLRVSFTVGAAGATKFFWSFEDGTFSTERDPQKTFYVEGRYDVRVTAMNDSGQWTHSAVEIRVDRPGHQQQWPFDYYAGENPR